MNLQEFIASNPDVRCFSGYDVGRYVDSGEFSCLVVSKGKGVERIAKTFRRVPFAEQQGFLESYLQLPRTHLAIDETGLGLPISEALRTRFRQRVRGVNFAATIDVPTRYQDRTAPAPIALAVTLKQAMLEGEVVWQLDRAKNAQMYSVRRSVTERGTMTFKIEPPTTETGHHHADVFWARALACWCWKMTDTRGRIEIRVIGA